MPKQTVGRTEQASTGVFFIAGGDWETIRKKMQEAGHITARMGDSLVSTVAAEGRRVGSKYENAMGHRMGGTYLKNTKTPGKLRGTVFDAKLGGFVSRTYRVGKYKAFRTMGFNFESAKAVRSASSFQRSISSISMYSLVANLWEESRMMPHGSGKNMWSYDGGATWGRQGRGIRPGRPFFLGKVRSAVFSSVPKAIGRVEKRYEKELSSI